MNQRAGGLPNDYECAEDEVILITIRPHNVGNTFTVSSPTTLVSGGAVGSEETVYRYVPTKEAGDMEVVRLRFRFPGNVPVGGFVAATWPRFEVELSEEVEVGEAPGTVLGAPTISQVEGHPAGSSRDLDLNFHII